MISQGQIIEVNGMKFYVDEVDYNGHFSLSLDGSRQFLRGKGEMPIKSINLKGVAEDG